MPLCSLLDAPVRPVVEVLAQLKTGRFDRPLSYLVPDAIALHVGDIVRVPLGSQECYGYVVSEPHEPPEPIAGLRAVVEKIDAPRAFGPLGLDLARWIAAHYVTTLGEALGAVVLGGALPRVIDRYEVGGEAPQPERYPSVPPRLLRLIWGDFRAGFTREALLRHAEARRCGDRPTLVRHLTALERSGAISRRREFSGARMTRARVSLLLPGTSTVAGRKAAALAGLVRERGELRRADALLAGFSAAVVARALKAGAIRLESREVDPSRDATSVQLPDVVPTGEQTAALHAIERGLAQRAFGELLVHGVTGSGKTYVYIAAIARVLESGGRAIVLVPEIALTPQTARRFEAAFGARVAVLHSALSDRERFESWQAAGRGEVSVVVGARSAVFAPLEDVRLIVVDEAHETSYKQDSVPRYHAVTVARERMKREGGVLVLGSATPSLESFALAQAGRIPLAVLAARATAQPPPSMRIVDMSAEFAAGNKRMFSSALAAALEERLARSEKSVLFINRRGSASFLLCRGCGHVPNCVRCSTSYAVHRTERVLRCHYCDAQAPVPTTCPQCGAGPIREFGAGTERVVEEVERLWPHARIVRMDSDTTTRLGDHARLLEEFDRRGDILVGTQMVAKGLDFPTVTLAGVIAADIGLHIAEYRAAERTFALIMQVSGRSGRAMPGEAIIQTYSPQHPALVYAARGDYAGFANEELALRKLLGYPPFGALVYLGIIGRAKTDVERTSETYARLLREADVGTVLGPAPYPIARVNQEWRYRIAVRTRTPSRVRRTLRETILPLAHANRATRLAINVDP